MFCFVSNPYFLNCSVDCVRCLVMMLSRFVVHEVVDVQYVAVLCVFLWLLVDYRMARTCRRNSCST